jgi:hypothetical protein
MPDERTIRYSLDYRLPERGWRREWCPSRSERIRRLLELKEQGAEIAWDFETGAG